MCDAELDRRIGNISHKMRSEVAGSSVLLAIGIAIDLIYTAVLGRLLQPSDYGIIVAAMLLISVADLLRDIGIGSTIIQTRSLSHNDQRTALSLLLVFGAINFVAVQTLASLFSSFMGVPQAEEALRWLSIIILFQIFSTLSQSLLLRGFQARRLVALEILSKAIAYGVFGIGLATYGFGYWSLVASAIIEAALRSAALTWIAKPALIPGVHADSIQRLLGSGTGFAASRIINFVALRADITIVTRYMDVHSAGLYSRAYKLMSLPTDLYGKVADRSLFPALARVQGERDRLRRGFLRAVELTSLVGMPLTIFLFLTSPEIVVVLLGKNWSDMVPVFSLLAVGTYFRLSARVSGSVLRATGSIGKLVANQALYASLTIAGSLYGVQYSLEAVGACIGLAIVAWYILITIQACQVTSASHSSFLAAHLPGLRSSLATLGVLLPLLILLRELELNAFWILFWVLHVGLACVFLTIVLVPRWLLGTEGALAARYISGEAWRILRGRRPA